MTMISRRNFVLSAAGAAAVFGLDRRVEFITSAHAQFAAEPKPFHKFKVGEIEVTTVYDGLWQKPHDPGFTRNASVDEVKAALRKAGQPDDYVPIPFTVTFVKVGGKTVMFDSSTGGQTLPPGSNGKIGLMLEANMKAAGIEPASVSAVLVTHFHPDHIFGLMERGTNAQVFPNADIVLPAGEYKFWTDEAVFNKLPQGAHGLAKRIQATFPQWKNVRQAEDNAEVLAGIKLINTNGHTPGHSSYVLGSGSAQLWVSGDITNIPALNMTNPGLHIVFDSIPDLAETNRRRFFEKAIAEKAVVTGYHWGVPGAGTIVKDGNGYAFVPVA